MQDTMERMLIRKAYENREPITGSLELLPLCNMNCEMCYVRLSPEEVCAKGGLRSAGEWLRIAEQMRDNGTLFVMLTGGEPLLYPEFRQVYTGLQKLGMIVTVNTNGTLIDEQWTAFFREHPPRRVNVTLYGAQEKTYKEICHFPGGFEKACQGVRRLCQAGISVKINGSLVKGNAEDIDWLIAFAKEQGAAINIDTYMYPAKRERTVTRIKEVRLDAEAAARQRMYFKKKTMEQNAFLQMAEECCFLTETPPDVSDKARAMNCLAGKASFAINWQGQMRPCVMMSEPSFPVQEYGFAESWKRLCTKTDQILLGRECGGCKLRKICQICAASALHETGDTGGVPSYMCRYTRALRNICQGFLSEEAAAGVQSTNLKQRRLAEKCMNDDGIKANKSQIYQ